VAQAVAGLYPQSGGKPVDLVTMIDTNGLGALLERTGPLAVRSWPEPVTAANATSILGIQQYERYPDNEKRVAFLAELTRTTFERILTLDAKRYPWPPVAWGGPCATATSCFGAPAPRSSSPSNAWGSRAPCRNRRRRTKWRVWS